MGCTYNTFSDYLVTKQSLWDRIAAIDLLIEKGILLMADTISGVGGNISAYELDDGQVKIKTNYRSIEDVESGLKALERMKNLYMNQLNGRSTVLRDHKTFR